MQIAAGILTNTPVWVFALLAYLTWQGFQSLRPRTLPIWQILVVPVVFLLFGLSRLVMARGAGLEASLAWFSAALLFVWLALSRTPRLLAVDRKRGMVTRPGSAIPLLRNIGVFVLQYGVGVATAMKLEPRLAVAIVGHAVSGASAGYFSGWAAALVRRYRNSIAPKAARYTIRDPRRRLPARNRSGALDPDQVLSRTSGNPAPR